MEKFVLENGGSLENILFPYREVSPGSRRFDLTQFDAAYWQRFRQQCQYLQARGIILHLLMWNGWQLGAADSPGRDQSSVDWDGHFFNPANNVNSFTRSLGGDLKQRLRIYHSVADQNQGLVQAQQAWFRKLLDATADLDNVYYDLVHELAEHRGEWVQTRQWIEAMARTIHEHWQSLEPKRPLLLGMDTGGLSAEEREWIFTHPDFNLLIYGKKHSYPQAVEWRIRYRKPYIPQESWDDDGVKYSYLHPEQRTHTRKYLWKMMMAKCQQLDVYMKRRPGFSEEGLPAFPHNYDPRGRNPLEEDARILRRFWESLVEYPELWFEGEIRGGPGEYRYLLASRGEVVVYFSSATGEEGIAYDGGKVRLGNLPLEPGRTYLLEIVDPKGDRGVLERRPLAVAGRELEFSIPSFVDDLAVHIYRPSH